MNFFDFAGCASNTCHHAAGHAEEDMTMTAAVKARVSLNLPASLKSAAERYAERDGVSLNQFISIALAEKVGAQGAAEFFTKRGDGGDVGAAIAFLRNAPDVEPKAQDRID